MFETFFKYPLEKYLSGKLRLGSGLRVELAVLAIAVVVAGAVYYYRRAPMTGERRTRLVLSALRGFALAVMVLILFEPLLRIPRHYKRDSFVVVLLDDSRSMRIRDETPVSGFRFEVSSSPQPETGNVKPETLPVARVSRLELARELLGTPDEDKLWRRLSAVCPVQGYAFSSSVKPFQSVAAVKGSGERTDLYAALKDVDAELRGVPVVGIVCLSDGAVNAGGAPQDMAQELGARKRPVYCIGLGNPNPPQDYEVLSVRAPSQVRNNAAVEVFANVRAIGFDAPFNVLLRQGKDILQTVEGIVPEPGQQIYRVHLTFRPEKKGTFTYTVEVPPHEKEVIRDNNRRDFLVNVVDDRLPVLYLEGSPREEYRFLRRAMLRDTDFRIASILRLDGPQKFVLQGAEDEDGLQDGYPKSLEHLGRFQAVIFGDINADYLTPQQLKMTEEFVKNRGGGFLMLGGVNSFNLGRYQGTPIADMLPVILPGVSVGYKQVEFNVHVTKAGETHSIMRQSANTVLNRDIWSKAPTLIGYNPVLESKPLAQVLAVEPKSGIPILTVQDYGAGKAAAFLTGGSWHWRMAVPLENELHEKFWKQLVRWLAVGAKPRMKLELDKDLYSLEEPVSLRAILLDQKFEPINDAAIAVQITDPFGQKLKDSSGKETPMRLNWNLSEPGVYEAHYEPPDAGDYTVTATAALKNQPPVTARATFSVGETLDEYSDAGQKVVLLKELATISGGRYFKPEEAKELPGEIEKAVGEEKQKETLYEQHDVWDTPLWFGLLVAALLGEWIIRRRRGLV